MKDGRIDDGTDETAERGQGIFGVLPEAPDT
jgi:hypothetical protein